MTNKPLETKRLFKNQKELVLKGDHKIFNKMAEPYLDEMSQIAKREHLYHQYLGHFRQDDLDANELLGKETLDVLGIAREEALKDKQRGGHKSGHKTSCV